VVRKNDTPTVNKDSTPLSIFMLICFKIIQLLVEQTLPATLGHTWQRMFLTVWCDHSGNVLLFICYCADGAQSKGHTTSLLV